MRTWLVLRMAEPQVRDFNVMFGEEGGSWLGRGNPEVTSDNAKELKLPGERGVVLGRIAPDSPASKIRLRENDVVTEINGQQVEGADAISTHDSRNSCRTKRATYGVARRTHAGKIKRPRWARLKN